MSESTVQRETEIELGAVHSEAQQDEEVEETKGKKEMGQHHSGAKENEVEEEEESVSSTSSSASGEGGDLLGDVYTTTKSSPYHLLGACCFCSAICVGIACVVVSGVLTAESELDNDALKYVFGSFFGAFLGFLFLCLCCTYYLGASKESWKTPDFEGLRKNFVNLVAIAGLVIEFIQICSFSFNRTRLFAGLDLRPLNYLAVPVGEGTGEAFETVYWVMFVVAFTPYIFVIVVRIFISVYTVKWGENKAATLVEKFQDKIQSVLWFLVNTLYFPVIGTMVAGTDCTFSNSVTLDANPEIECLRGRHIAILVCSQLALIIYYPAASFAQAQTQNISDIKFKPRIVFVMLQGKFVMATISIFFTTNYLVYYISLFVLNVAFLLLNILGQPCLVNWVNRMRTVLFSMVLWATVCAGAIATWALDDEENILPGILLLAGWPVILLAYIIIFLALGRYKAAVKE